MITLACFCESPVCLIAPRTSGYPWAPEEAKIPSPNKTNYGLCYAKRGSWKLNKEIQIASETIRTRLANPSSVDTRGALRKSRQEDWPPMGSLKAQQTRWTGGLVFSVAMSQDTLLVFFDGRLVVTFSSNKSHTNDFTTNLLFILHCFLQSKLLP